MKRIGFVLLCSGLLSSCVPAPTSDDIQNAKQEALSKESGSQVGLPGITKFTEKRLMRQLYELRDQNVATETYVPDLQGHLWHLCSSIGYGLPYGAQFTSPERMSTWYLPNQTSGPNSGVQKMPQPEPNGLFMPPTAEGTWIVCSGDGGAIRPVYVEPRVIVSPFELNSVGEYQKVRK